MRCVTSFSKRMHAPMASILPSPKDVIKEALVVLGGAVLAAYIIGQVPQLRTWMKAQWGGAIPQGDKSAW